jgi:hypothetical protein
MIVIMMIIVFKFEKVIVVNVILEFSLIERRLSEERSENGK